MSESESVRLLRAIAEKLGADVEVMFNNMLEFRCDLCGGPVCQTAKSCKLYPDKVMTLSIEYIGEDGYISVLNSAESLQRLLTLADMVAPDGKSCNLIKIKDTWYACYDTLYTDDLSEMKIVGHGLERHNAVYTLLKRVSGFETKSNWQYSLATKAHVLKHENVMLSVTEKGNSTFYIQITVYDMLVYSAFAYSEEAAKEMCLSRVCSLADKLIEFVNKLREDGILT